MKKLTKNKKGQITSALIAGVAGLIVLIIVSLLIVDTLDNANLIPRTQSSASQNAATLIDGAGLSMTTCAATVYDPAILTVTMTNHSSGASVDAANYTFSDCVIIATAASDLNNTLVNITYTFDYDGNSVQTVDDMIVNYSEGINNVSEKIPTVLLLAAVVLLFGAIVFLVQRSREVSRPTGGSI